MADNSLITKAHLRATAENLVEKLQDTNAMASVIIGDHNNDTSAHQDIRNLIPKSAADLDAPTKDEMNSAIAAIPTPDVSGQIGTHNVDETAHQDIRNAITALEEAPSGVPIVTAASSDGIAYTATVADIDALSAGQLIVFIPAVTSASTAPTLNINDLGAKTIKRRQSNLSSTTAAGLANNWLFLNKPQLMMYDGTYWIVVNQDKPSAGDLYGAVGVDHGGTGATDAVTALANLGAASTVTYTATVTTTWTASGDYYYQDIAISGLLESDNPIMDILPGSDNAANVSYNECICKVFRAITSANSLRVWATEAIANAFPIQLKVVR